MHLVKWNGLGRKLACSDNPFGQPPSLTAVQRRFVFVDESGDFGLSSRSSRFVTIAAISTNDPRQFERIPLRVRKRRLKKSVLSVGELKFHDSSRSVRIDFLRRIEAVRDAHIHAITFEKTQTSRTCASHAVSGDSLYFAMVRGLIGAVVMREKPFKSFAVVLDERPLGMPIGRRFTDRLEACVVQDCRDLSILPPDIRLSRMSSANCGGLQAADFAAGAIRRRHEWGDATYHGIISDKIVTETKYPRKREGADPGRIIPRASQGAP